MYIIIIGGGKVGYYLAKTLAPEHHKLVLVDEDYDLCKKLASELSGSGIDLLYGDGTNTYLMKDAGIEKADMLIAVTGYDQNNLVACQLAKKYFAVPHTIARVNNPKNINVFKRLGVDSVVSSTARIAEIIGKEVDWTDINRVLMEKVGDVRIREVSVAEGSLAEGKNIAEIGLPKGTIIASVIRKNKIIVPNGQTQLLAGDDIIVVANEDGIEHIYDYFSKR
ncbi:potassium channel family protein [Mahella australiensis]|uniref:Trk system potassium uptake protein TrkA n=1 Tax=Mahella australiensis (strain DSM 15567 / CIP 107919 / 50-1 BON) TaxID=697281 RepID=F4A0D1_MAHA5|nr:NAD-binding protein [Mahella australiensis]AEE97992.1 TrkA-N domain protein [Mahella australiensis 50-1 BON]